MIFPFKGEYRVTRKFGIKDPAYHNYPDSRHSGTDWGLPENTPLYAAMDGTVEIYNRDSSVKVGRGKEVSLLSGNTDVNTCHMNRIDVVQGQFVKEGQQIGLSGYTGYVIDAGGNVGTPEGAHLHAEVKVNGQYVDPEQYFKKEEDDMFTDTQIDHIISLCYNLISAKPPTDADFKLHREQFKTQKLAWMEQLLEGFDKTNNVAWKKPGEYLPVGQLFVKKG